MFNTEENVTVTITVCVLLLIVTVLFIDLTRASACKIQSQLSAKFLFHAKLRIQAGSPGEHLQCVCV